MDTSKSKDWNKVSAGEAPSEDNGKQPPEDLATVLESSDYSIGQLISATKNLLDKVSPEKRADLALSLSLLEKVQGSLPRGQMNEATVEAEATLPETPTVR